MSTELQTVPQRTYLTWATFVGLSLLLGLMFAPSIAWVASQWSAGGVVGHGYLVAVITLWLLWRARSEIAAGLAKPAWFCMPLLVGLSIVWLLGFVANVVAVQTIVLPAIWWCAVLLVFGRRVAASCFFAIAYLYCALPALDMTQPFFQSVTSTAVGIALSLFGIPALLEGNIVLLPGGSFEIAEGCAGLSYLLAGVSVALLYGHLYYRRWTASVALFAAIVLVSMMGNWIRVLVIIAIGHYAGMDHPMVADHLSLGWVIFAFTVLPVLFFAHKFEPIVAPTNDTDEPTSVSSATPLSVIAVLLALSFAAVGPAWAWYAATALQTDADANLVLPAADGWQGPLTGRTSWQPDFAGADQEMVRQYQIGRQQILVYANVYFSQQQDRELIYFANDIAGTWRREVRKKNEPRIASGDEYFRELTARSIVARQLIWYRYEVNGRSVDSPREAKLQQALAVLRGQPAAGVIAISAKCEPDCDSARDVLREFTAKFEYNLGTILSKKDDHAED